MSEQQPDRIFITQFGSVLLTKQQAERYSSRVRSPVKPVHEYVKTALVEPIVLAASIVIRDWDGEPEDMQLLIEAITKYRATDEDA